MLYPQVDAKSWSELYDIPSSEAHCLKCGDRQEFTTPFAYKEFRGLLSSHLECGEEFQQSIFVTIDKKERLKLNDLFNFVTSSSSCVL